MEEDTMKQYFLEDFAIPSSQECTNEFFLNSKSKEDRCIDVTTGKELIPDFTIDEEKKEND